MSSQGLGSRSLLGMALFFLVVFYRTHALDLKSQSVGFKTLGLCGDRFRNLDNCCVAFDTGLINLLLKGTVLEGTMLVDQQRNLPPGSSCLSSLEPWASSAHWQVDLILLDAFLLLLLDHQTCFVLKQAILDGFTWK